MPTISVLGTENVTMVTGYDADNCIEEYEVDDYPTQAVEMIGKYERYRVQCACGCAHYIRKNGYEKWKPSEYCEDHNYMRS